MTNADFDFETWCDSLQMMVLDGCGVKFQDFDSVRVDYDKGRNVADIADVIIAEYEGAE